MCPDSRLSQVMELKSQLMEFCFSKAQKALPVRKPKLGIGDFAVTQRIVGYQNQNWNLGVILMSFIFPQGEYVCVSYIKHNQNLEP